MAREPGRGGREVTPTHPTLTFLGAAGSVTGSRFLLDGAQGRVMVDAGLYQGLKELRLRNWQPLEVDPSSLDAIVLTHAHLDHSGALPRLTREGYSGPILCTAPTAELATLILRDSAHLQEEDAAYANRVGSSRHKPALPLYDAADVEHTVPLFRPIGYDEPTMLAEDISLTLRPAGHILGSASALIEIDGSRVLFSGDLGRVEHPVLAPRVDPPAADVVVLESTYGDRTHPKADPSILADAVNRTVDRGGVVLIPAFAVDRTELVLWHLRGLIRAGAIPPLTVFVDSPMALAALRIYRAALRNSPDLFRADLRGERDPFDTGDLHPVRTSTESQRLNRPGGSCIIVSASGMATGGRVVHHLASQLPDPRNCVVLTGYQALGTRGRRLLEGATELKMFGEMVPVRAEVVDFTQLSVHADGSELISWLSAMPEPPRSVFVVHGDPPADAVLARRIHEELGWPALPAQLGDRVRVD